MKPFAALAQAGRTARLRRLALGALASYDLPVVSIRPLSTHFNAVFRVDTAAGERAVLRVNRPGNRSLVDVRSELVWVDALARDTDLTVPAPIRTRDGALATTVAIPGVPEPRHCALFRWINGRGVADRPFPRLLFALGAAMARLHDHAGGFAPPPGFTTRRLDAAWTFGRPARLYDDGPDDIFTSEHRAILRAGAARVEAVLADLYADPAELRFLHGDLHLGNVKATPAGLAILDFDDCTWGYPVQDVGVSLFYLEYHPAYHDLRAAFTRGYESVRPWPEAREGQVDACIAARWFDLISLVCSSGDPSDADYLPGLLAKGIPQLAAWLER